MYPRMVVEFPNGSKIVLAKPGSATGATGRSQVGLGDIPKIAAEKFLGALGSLVSIIQAVGESVERMDKRPHRIEVEFRALIGAEGNLCLIAGDAEAEFKVTLEFEWSA